MDLPPSSRRAPTTRQQLGVDVVERWAQSTLGHSPVRAPAQPPPAAQPVVPYVRDDGWRLDEAIEDWMSDASYSSRRSVGPGGYHSRGQRHAGPPSVDAPTSISDAQTMLHDLYHSMQRQHQQPAGLSPAVRGPPFSPPMPSTAPPTTPAPPTEFPAHVRSRLAAAFERSVGHVT